MPDIVLNRDMYLQVANERKTLSMLLEEMDPTPEGEKLDAFQRQLRKAGIRTKTLSQRGIWADQVEAFYRTNDSQVLFPEFVARQAREAVAQDTVLPFLIGQQTLITGDAYRTYYVEDQPEKARKKRVVEGSELPKATLKGKEQTVRIYKFGRQIEASYEAIRRMQIDMLALHVRRISMQTAKDKVEEIVSVIKDGDGNNNAATIHKLTDLDASTTAGTLTRKGLIAFLMKFDVFPCDTLIASEDAFLQVLLNGAANLSALDVMTLLRTGATAGITVDAPQLPQGNFRLFWNSTIAANTVHGINRQYAIEEVTEAGSDISEADKFITRQTQVLTVSENSGYSKMFNEATKTLNLGA